MRMLKRGAHGSITSAHVQRTPDCLAHRSMKGCTGRGPTGPVVAMRAVHYCPFSGVGSVEVHQLPDKLVDGLRLRCLHGTETLRRHRQPGGMMIRPFRVRGLALSGHCQCCASANACAEGMG